MASEDALEIPVGVTEKAYMRQVARLEAETLRAVNKMETRVKRFERSSSRSFRQVNRSAGAFANGGLRQVSMQLSQVAQQGAATGDWGRALSIQFADLALGFGTVGIAIGALATVLGPVVFDMLATADAAKELDDALKSLEASAQSYQSAQSALSSGSYRKEYGALSDQARELLKVERQIAEVRAQAALDAVTKGAAEAFGISDAFGLNSEDIADFRTVLADLKAQRLEIETELAGVWDGSVARERAEELNKALHEVVMQITSLEEVASGSEKLAESLGISEEEARQVAERFADIGAAEGPREQAEAMVALASELTKITGGLENADEETQDLVEKLRSAAEAILDIAKVDIASGIGKGADEAGRLADNLAAAIGLTGVIGGRAVEGGVESGSIPPWAAQDIETDADRAMDRVLEARRQAARAEAKKAGRKKGGGGQTDGEKELNRLLRERERIVRELETASERYQRKLEDLNRLQKMGKLSSEQYAQALAKLDMELAQAEFAEAINGMNSFVDSMVQAGLEGESLRETMKNSLRQIAADILSSRIKENLLDVFSASAGSGGSGGGLFGKIIGGLFGRRAAGGPVQAGRAYMVGENGPEPFVPAVNGRVLSAAQAQDAMRPAAAATSGEVTVRVEGGDLMLTDGGQVAARIRVSAMHARSGAVQDVKSNWGDFQRVYDQDGALT